MRRGFHRHCCWSVPVVKALGSVRDVCLVVFCVIPFDTCSLHDCLLTTKQEAADHQSCSALQDVANAGYMTCILTAVLRRTWVLHMPEAWVSAGIIVCFSWLMICNAGMMARSCCCSNVCYQLSSCNVVQWVVGPSLRAWQLSC